MVNMGMVCGHLIIQAPVDIHFIGPSSGQAVAGFHGVEAVAESLVAGEDFVDGNSKESVAWGPSMKLGGSARTSPDVDQWPIPIARNSNQ
jgi:hypothetical protein